MPKSAAASLYRALGREARHMTDYNFRSYAIRKVRDGFRQGKSLQGEEATAAINYGKEQLEVLKRQAILGKLYPSGKSVME